MKIDQIDQTNISRAKPVSRPVPSRDFVPHLAAVLVTTLLFVSPLSADTAESPPEGVLWTSLVLSSTDAPISGDAVSSGSLDFLALGIGAEYGVLPWASLAADWRPGFLLSSHSSLGSTGSFSDFRLSLRLALLGSQALIRVNPFRLALIAGVTVPLPSADTGAWEPDLHLWGIRGGFSFDYIPHDLFQVNLAAVAVYYPEQASDNPAFSRQGVSHPLELRAELEPRLTYLTPSGVILALPLVYEYSAESTVRGQPLDDEGHLLSLGVGYTIAIRDIALPVEIGLRYLTPVYDVNHSRLQRLEFVVKTAIPLKK
jgi:hypothetical protein